MEREDFIKAIAKVVKKTNMPNNDNGINLEKICTDFALLAFDEALILNKVIRQSEQLKEKDIVLFQNYVEYKYLQEGDEYFNRTTLKTENLKQVIAKFNKRKN